MNYIVLGGKLSQDDVRRGACRNLKAGDVRSRPLFQHPETQVEFGRGFYISNNLPLEY